MWPVAALVAALAAALAAAFAAPAAARAPAPGAAAPLQSPPQLFGLDVVNAGVRVRVGGERVIGQEQPEAFREWDVWANLRLPWLRRYSAGGWGVETRLLSGVGVMKGKEDAALVLSVLPTLAFGSSDGRWSFDAGIGAALLSRHRFAQQDFGGYAQFALTAGVSVPIYRNVGAGYRFMHYSDAALYGTDTIGADFHMVELIYRF
jgi:hypothetical protein